MDSSRLNNTSSVKVMKPALVFDLDDTIVHVTQLLPKQYEHKFKDSQELFSILVNKTRFFVHIRPNFQEFITNLSTLFEIFIFTSSKKEYANPIIDKILPNVKPENRFFKDSCRYECGYSVKDLSLLNRPMDTVLLVDDTAGSALLNRENLILVDPWYGESDDSLFSNLSNLLNHIAFENNIVEAFLDALKTGRYQGISGFP